MLIYILLESICCDQCWLKQFTSSFITGQAYLFSIEIKLLKFLALEVFWMCFVCWLIYIIFVVFIIIVIVISVFHCHKLKAISVYNVDKKQYLRTMWFIRHPQRCYFNWMGLPFASFPILKIVSETPLGFWSIYIRSIIFCWQRLWFNNECSMQAFYT